jgi:hypothetical protein
MRTSTFPKGIAQPAVRALNALGFYTLEDLEGVSESFLIEQHGMGPKAITIIKTSLANQGRQLIP